MTALYIVTILFAICITITFVSVRSNKSDSQTEMPDNTDESHEPSNETSTPSPNPATEAPAAAQTASNPTPGSVLNLTNWKLTLPTGKPDEITQPQLKTFSVNPYFQLNSAKNGVVFQANAGGATTQNSGYPRSELREMTSNGSERASWSNTSGSHVMTITQAITHVPAVKPHVVAGQIHDDSDDIIEIRLEGTNLFVENNGKSVGVLDSGYKLGTTFTVRVEASGGHIKVSYNGKQKVDFTKSGSDWYFKAGCYTQSNTSKGDKADAYGQVIIYNLTVSHS